MEGGIGFGLGAILKGAITLEDGRVEQTNFDAYDVLRIDEMPEVEVHIVPSTERPTGVGEPGVPPIGPAVANAVFAADRQAGAGAAVQPQRSAQRLSRHDTPPREQARSPAGRAGLACHRRGPAWTATAIPPLSTATNLRQEP